jgi:hypothetical protein
MVKSCVLFFYLFFFLPVLAAQPSIEWAKAYGGTGADQAYAICQTIDGGYIVAGTSPSNNGDVFGNHGGLDFWVLKLTNTGTIQWKKSYGGSSDEQAYSVKETVDGGYVVTGYTLSTNQDISGNHGYYDAWVLKLDNAGAIQWQKCLGGGNWDEGNEVLQTKDGGYVIIGRSRSSDGDATVNFGSSDFWVIKLDSTGNVMWQRSHGGSSEDIGYGIKETTDGGYIVCGESSSVDGEVTGNHGDSDYWILKLNFEGKIEWEQSLGGTSIDRANSIIQARDGGFVALGQTYSINGDITGNHGFNDYWVVKLSASGILEWQKALGGSNEDYARAICQTEDGGYVLTGQTQSNNGDAVGNDGGADIWLVKLTELGELEWQRTLGGTQDELGNSVQQTTDGGYILAGQARSNNGDVMGVHGEVDYWVIKLSPESSPTTTPISTPITIYPNPAHNTITLSLPTQESDVFVTVTDLLGRELRSQMVTIALDGTVKLDIGTLPESMYLVSATTPSGQVFFGKVLKQE